MKHVIIYKILQLPIVEEVVCNIITLTVNLHIIEFFQDQN